MSNKLSERRSLARRISGVTMPIERRRMKWQRNWPCLCGSKIKYKNCCLGDTNRLTSSDGNAQVKEIPENIQKMVDAHLKAKEQAEKK